MALLKKFSRRPELRAQEVDLTGIISNLNNILNTRKGYGSFLSDFGIRDMNEFISRDHIALAVMKEVEDNIRKFEPRVELIQITRVDDDNPLRLSFQIECRLRNTSQSIHMVFDSVYSSVNLRSDYDPSSQATS
ncbi:MAG TPA: type VI secretion system baseplate subunit TssE [Syntrophobacteraceae bacterium]|nr:type VI secretion system baseplate subunit TssE [Syntrophobacteraceae bacterium]